MNHTRRAIVLLLGLMLFAAPAFARMEYSLAHIAFDVPDAWPRVARGHTAVVGSPDGNLVVEVDYVTSQAET